MAIGDILGKMSVSLAAWLNLIIFVFGLFVMVMLIIAIIAFVVVRKRKIKVNLFQERSGGGSYKFVPMDGKRKYRHGATLIRLYKMGVVDKLVPDIDQDYMYQDKGGKDTVNLVMDKRGFLHKLKLPSINEIIDFTVYKKLLGEIQAQKVGNPEPISANVVKLIFDRRDELKKGFVEENPEYDIEGIPNMHETIEQVNAQIKEGSKKFGSTVEKYAGVLIIGGAMFVSLMMITMAMIMSQKIIGG